jgi:DNA-binding CsgD family transcriptional regulator
MLSRKRALSDIGLSAREMEIIALSKEGLTD